MEVRDPDLWITEIRSGDVPDGTRLASSVHPADSMGRQPVSARASEAWRQLMVPGEYSSPTNRSSSTPGAATAGPSRSPIGAIGRSRWGRTLPLLRESTAGWRSTARVAYGIGRLDIRSRRRRPGSSPATLRSGQIWSAHRRIADSGRRTQPARPRGRWTMRMSAGGRWTLAVAVHFAAAMSRAVARGRRSLRADHGRPHPAGGHRSFLDPGRARPDHVRRDGAIFGGGRVIRDGMGQSPAVATRAGGAPGPGQSRRW